MDSGLTIDKSENIIEDVVRARLGNELEGLDEVHSVLLLINLVVILLAIRSSAASLQSWSYKESTCDEDKNVAAVA